MTNALQKVGTDISGLEEEGTTVFNLSVLTCCKFHSLRYHLVIHNRKLRELDVINSCYC